MRYLGGKYARRAALLAMASAAPISGTAHAQANAARASAVQEIIVTARKRQESILNVPVVETALPAQQLERLQTHDLKDIAKLVPGLALGDSVLSTGTQVSLRGVGTSALDPGVDASVSLNLDGLQLSQGLAYMSGMFDIGQVEVLKGPQALFYGKSSPGGVISIRSADPTDTPEIIARLGYEFEAREKRGELIVSGPVNDTLKVRLAGAWSRQDGFYRNVAVALPNLGARNPPKRIGGEKSYMLRATALWNPTSQFDARLKLNQVRDRITIPDILQFAVCPDGTGPALFGLQFFSPFDDCKLNRTAALVTLDPAAFPGIINNGVPYLETTQTYGSLEMNYRPTAGLTLTSTTGYYLIHARSLYNTQAAAAGPFLAVTNGFHRREVTEEVRLNSDFAGPLNFTAGGFIQRGQFSDLVTLFANQQLGLPLPPILQKGIQIVDIHTNSVFGQLRYKITPELELAAGARWTDEKRTDTSFDMITSQPVPITLAVPQIHSKNTSPELTLTYRPADTLTFFGALKRGYKSGSFNVATPAFTGRNNAFGDEKVQGGEVGMKSRWFDRRLAFDIAAYDYKYSGLQVGANTPTVNGLVETRTVNAGSAHVYGVEADAAYRPPQIAGLGLRASVNWNHGRFTELQNVPCYGGQTIAAGCNELFVPSANNGTGGFSAQDRSGVPLIRAPDWQANFGFDYETAVGRDMTLIVSSSTQYSSKYLANLGYLFYQKAFFKTDLSLTLQGPNDRWEVALIGKNLNNKLTSGNCSNANNQAGLIGGQVTGSTGSGPAGVDETGCFMDRGREVWVRVTLKPLS